MAASRRQLGGIHRASTGLFGSSSSAGPTPLQTLQTALGSDLVALWEVPATDDASIDVISGRVDRLASLIGGNPLQAVASANRPKYTTVTEGLEGEPCLEIDATDVYMDAALNVAANNRAALFTVWKPNLGNGIGNKIVVTTISGADDSTIGYGNTALQHRAKYAFTTAGEVQLTSTTSPTTSDDSWYLASALPLATGAKHQIGGVDASPNFAVSETGRAIATARVGFTSTSGTGRIKLFAVVTNISAAYNTAMQAYVAARWPRVGQRLKRIVWSGQSNPARLVLTDFPEAPGYMVSRSAASGQPIAYWSKSGGGAGYAPLLAELAKSRSDKRIVLPWAQGEADSDTAPEAAAYYLALEQLRTDLETDLGRGSNYIYWVICRFHSDFLANASFPHASTVNAAFATFAAAHAGHVALIEPDVSGGSTVDGVHWGPDGGPSSTVQQYVMNAVSAAVVAAALP